MIHHPLFEQDDGLPSSENDMGDHTKTNGGSPWDRCITNCFIMQSGWRTKHNLPVITPAIEKVLYPFLENKAKRFGCFVHGINGTEDHVHTAMTIPPSESVSDIVGKLKGSSSYFLNKELQITRDFYWQDGFGVLSFAERDLPRVLHLYSPTERASSE
jgi:putative transposase